MLKKLMLASALVATSAFAQQNTDISGANFQSGKADAALATLGRQAAASGNKLVITAPAEWHAKIAAKVRAGGNANLVLREGFYENVLVRIEDKAAAAAAVAEPDKAAKADVEKSRAEAAKAKAEAEKSRAEAEKAKAEAEKARSEADAAKARADVETARAEAAAQQASAARAAAAATATPKPAPAPAAAKAPGASARATTDVDAIHSRLEQTLNDGRTASGSLPVSSLQQGDMLFIDGPVRAISRREGNRLSLYWLDGDLDLRRAELKMLSPSRYQLLGVIRGEATLRREVTQSASTLEAAEPAVQSPARVALEKSLNDGRTITQTIVSSKLKSGDIIYVNGSAVAVVRREGRDLTRYWLTGPLDLTQSGIVADGTNRYKVLNDTVR